MIISVYIEKSLVMRSGTEPERKPETFCGVFEAETQSGVKKILRSGLTVFQVIHTNLVDLPLHWRCFPSR